MNLRRVFAFVLGALLSAISAAAAPAPGTRILIVVGPSTHPPGTHEVPASGRLLQHCLENMSNVPGVKVDLVNEWPRDKAMRDRASSVVLLGDTFPAMRMPEPQRNMADLAAMMARGCGMTVIHYSTGLRAEDVSETGEHPLLEWTGGYFATRNKHHQSVAKVFESVTISPAAPAHPVSRGWRAFTMPEEPYYNNFFGGPGNSLRGGVVALAVSMLPPESPKREIVAWGTERKDGGRGFGIVMPHFYKNWADEDLRRFILNGIVWTAKLEVPGKGVQTKKPDLGAFGAESIEPKPREKKAKAAKK